MANKNLGLLGLIGIPIIIGYMYWVKQSNIKELENNVRLTKRYKVYDIDFNSKLNEDESLLDREKNSILPSTVFPIGLGEKITEKASDEYNNTNNAVKTFKKSILMRNRGGSVKQYKKNNKHTKKYRKN